jgi:Fe-S oxidoreductase
VLGIRAGLNAGLDQPLSQWISDDALWSCTTCGACNAACPVGIDVYHKIVNLRRGRVEVGVVPLVAEQLFDSIADRFNPFQRSNQERMLWAQGLRVPVAQDTEAIDLLYWVGCAGSFDPDGQTISRSMIKILNRLGINYRVLGTAERCTGDPARRLGEEGLYQELASANRALLTRHKVKRVLTHCPHCFNTMRNEYRAPAVNDLAADNDFDVIHHTQFLSDLLVSGRLAPAASESCVTYHDPCYLSRGNGIVDAPREALRTLQGISVAEMPRNGTNSFCCGAGGGSMWLDVRGEQRIENVRYQEALSTGAETIVTGCPFCKTMLEAARQANSSDDAAKRVRIRDLAEVIVDTLRL